MTIDHVVYGVADLDAGVEELAERLGVRPAAGGRHVGRGTHNALLGLGGAAYLEVIAVDPEQPPPAGPLPFGLDRLRLPRLVGWASRTTEIDRRRAEAVSRGHDPGEVRTMSRRRPDGSLLEWRLTRDAPDPSRLVVPFLIDWGASPHPSESAPAGARLVELRAEHPDPGAVQAELAALGVTLPVDEGPEPALVATLETPRGRVVVR
ncbi:MAG TPA: VOC family protein [Candidatus Dormibacteraeota bacterium]|nr:VOC family protein [Candidatus Dormibacteraeota bacterium]